MNGTKIDKRLATALPFLGVSFTTFGRITVSLPLGALAVCFVTAMLFSFDEVNPTMCGVGSKEFCRILTHSLKFCFER
jgi:ABC-type spermidine/putrescine transport system permease subunit II